MATLTRNLFAGNGERDFRLRVVEGHWPSDVEGAVFVVGPDKRGPGGHWLVEHGLLQKVDLVPDRDGRIVVRHRSIRTPVARLRRRLPWLFKRLEFMELSPFGVSNLANTNVQGIDGRLFVGYDAGRPVEVDPETLAFVTFVGHNDEWLQAAPGVLEPLCAVAAHPAPDLDERALWFVNYSQVALPGDPKETWIARWGLDGPIRRWRVEGMSAFDSIHDIKATANHLVFTDLPFVVEPGTFTGAPREQRNQEHTTMWIVAKDELHRTPPGGSVGCLEVRLPIPTGHVYADHDEVDGRLRVVVQHVPLGDLLLSMTPTTIDHRNQAPIDPAYEGLIALAVQPSVIGRYEIDLATGEVHDAELAMDVDRAWGGILPTTDTYSPAARAHQRNLWYAGAGFDPGGIGKGLAADLVTADLMAAGAVGVCVSVGGDVRVRGTAPGGTPWTIAVEHPLAAAPVTLVGLWDGALATSSVLRRVWQAGGRPRHHIIEPDTGVPARTTADLASVIAGDGWLAEVLTKPVLLRPADRRFDNVPSGCAALAVVADGTVAATASMSRFTGGALVPTVLRSVERTHPGGAR